MNARFESPYEQLRDRVGQIVTVLRVIVDPDPVFYDAEVLPMAEVRFPDGFESAVWPEELPDLDWPTAARS